MSPTSLDTWEIGGLFSIPSASTSAILRTSLETALSAGVAFSGFLVHCSSLSHAPPKCGALGLLKFHLWNWNSPSLKFYLLKLHLWCTEVCILSSSNCLMNFRISLFAPTKFIPLSLWMLCSRPHPGMSLFNAMMKCVESSSTSSRWHALVLVQVNKHPYTLTSLRLSLTDIGPKKSTPMFLNTTAGSGLHYGRLPIPCSWGFTVWL